jgi:hypothetical protein
MFFQLGKTTSYKWGLNGFYAQVRLNFKENSFLGTREAVEKYREKVYKLPLTKAKFTTVPLTKEGEEISWTGNENYDATKRLRIPTNGGAEEYAIYGWFKLVRVNEYWINLFRVSQLNTNGDSRIGDRDLALWVYWPA